MLRFDYHAIGIIIRKQMIAYRLLTTADFYSLYDCFLTAFSDYVVDMRMSREQFRQRLTRDGVCMELSAGAFDGERMIGFCMNALGEWQEKTCAYDAGSAIIPGYRGRGIATEMFAFLEPKLKERAIVQYLLEVLTSNVPAATLYRKLGFVETRRLAVFRSDTRINREPSELSIRTVAEPNWPLYRSFWEWYPSWQNSIDTVARVANDRTIVEAYVNDECAGYGVVFTPATNLMQLAVSPQHRRHGIGSAILASLETSEPLKVNNIDEALKGTLAFYEANGYKQVLAQHEMIKTLVNQSHK
jgi:ribosomal protein S18 acetylase RimI-like enzyme